MASVPPATPRELPKQLHKTLGHKGYMRSISKQLFTVGTQILSYFTEPSVKFRYFLFFKPAATTFQIKHTFSFKNILTAKRFHTFYPESNLINPELQ